MKEGISILVALFITSLSANVLGTCFTNSFSKKAVGDKEKINSFTLFEFLVCSIVYLFILFGQSVSLFTVILGTAYGVATSLAKYYLIRAFSVGPMHLTLLVTTSSMLIPTMSGVFFGEKFSLAKLLVAVILIWFVYLSFDKKKEKAFNKKWLIYCLLAFLCSGIIGVLQKVHQTSHYSMELGGFLFSSFIFATAISFFRNQGKVCVKSLKSRGIFFAVVCGVCTFACNIINLKLSGLIPSQLFFPLINGGSIIINSICSVVIFKEKLNIKQAVGLIGGIICLILICIV